MIVSGNKKYGLSKAISEHFSDAKFFSRSNNSCDFSLPENRLFFAKQSLEHECYLSVSSMNEFNQLLLLRDVIQEWRNTKKHGRIIVVGSVLESITKDDFEFYAVEKNALRNFCRRTSLQIISHSLPGKPLFRLTYLSLGYLDTGGKRGEDKKTISCKYVVETIDWILKQPSAVNISEFIMEPTQNNGH